NLRGIAFVQSIAPVIEQSAVYAEFPRKPENVVARLHSFDRCVPKFLTVPFSLFPFHFAAPLQQSVHYETVSLQGVTPTIPVNACGQVVHGTTATTTHFSLLLFKRQVYSRYKVKHMNSTERFSIRELFAVHEHHRPRRMAAIVSV
ncbi:MAG: hypothetical protein WA744_09570, partial [Candidatus Acidiferrales bacterium]